jgi:hypothetical protein
VYYEPFHYRFPDVAGRETRTLTVFNTPELPPGDYGFTEAYCNEPGCDCRRVFFNVIEGETGRVVATIAYGWESAEYYAKWLGMDDPAMISSLQGPALNLGSPQSELALGLLAEMPLLLSDPQYVARLKRHYQMFKAAVNQEAGLRNKPKKPKSPRATHRKGKARSK